MTEGFKKEKRMIDLALAAGRARQSARTRFVHQEDTIPIYENFCFAFALFRQKTAEAVTEGKELVERLLGFQTQEGNFPIFVHDFPRCFDLQMGLKIAPFLIYLLRQFSGVLGELRLKVEEALKKAVIRRSDKPLWENRYRACLGEPLLPLDTALFSPADWTEWLITMQLAGETHFQLPFDSHLQILFTPYEMQEGAEPQPNPVEWLLAEGHYSPRLLRDHPHQLLCAPLFPITYTSVPFSSSSPRLLWQGEKTLHSLVAKSWIFDLPEGVEIGRGDLFEAQLYLNASLETQILVNGRKATTFQFGDRLTILTPTQSIELQFQLTKGSGDFFGHIFKANRPGQVLKGYESFDWQIGMRTLRRSAKAEISISYAVTSGLESHSSLFKAELSTASPMA